MKFFILDIVLIAAGCLCALWCAYRFCVYLKNCCKRLLSAKRRAQNQRKMKQMNLNAKRTLFVIKEMKEEEAAAMKMEALERPWVYSSDDDSSDASGTNNSRNTGSTSVNYEYDKVTNKKANTD